eukprot:TRINITY_DN28659_c0_g1_i1.p1 TRINITY_DN28659_c0_g1~~TRINITY_DN28659_c0_g1_i1.p1  ORF type:complete len:451 (+),score=121.09 TRINITY_DN28659_c0_g1_i1:142-1353(+)
MVCRTIKLIIYEIMRVSAKKMIVAVSFCINKEVIEFLNRLFDGEMNVWSLILLKMKNKFGCFDYGQIKERIFDQTPAILGQDGRLILFNSLTRILNLQWKKEVLENAEKNGFLSVKNRFSDTDLKESSEKNVKLKEMSIANFAGGSSIIAQAMGCDPSYPSGREKREKLLRQAIVCLKKALSTCPGNASSLRRLGDCYTMLAVPNESNSPYYTFAGHCYGHSLSELSDGCDRLLPSDSKAYMKLGYMLTKKGDFDNAEINFIKAYASDPDNSKALCAYADFLFAYRSNCPDVVKSIYEIAMGKGKKIASVGNNLAIFLATQGLSTLSSSDEKLFYSAVKRALHGILHADTKTFLSQRNSFAIIRNLAAFCKLNHDQEKADRLATLADDLERLIESKSEMCFSV